MKLLLDTHLLLWAASNSGRLSEIARFSIGDPENQVLFSPANLWEISIKRSLGRPDFTVDPRLLRRGLIDNGYQELPITGDHAIVIHDLPPLHKDPFDRILIAQAIFEGVLLLTSDEQVARYPGPIRKV